jgi:predicted patatin/cPLA2 family phospholipase
MNLNKPKISKAHHFLSPQDSTTLNTPKWVLESTTNSHQPIHASSHLPNQRELVLIIPSNMNIDSILIQKVANKVGELGSKAHLLDPT